MRKNKSISRTRPKLTPRTRPSIRKPIGPRPGIRKPIGPTPRTGRPKRPIGPRPGIRRKRR